MRIQIARIALLAAAIGLSANAASAACREDLAATAENVQRTRTDLQGAAPAAKCAAFRKHVAALGQVKTVFARCDMGQNKAKNAGQVTASIAEVTRQMRETCKN